MQHTDTRLLGSTHRSKKQYRKKKSKLRPKTIKFTSNAQQQTLKFPKLMKQRHSKATINKITCAIVLSSLQVARMEFLARSISSNEAPSETPRSLSAFSRDISDGAESSARELAWTGNSSVLVNARRGGRAPAAPPLQEAILPGNVEPDRRTVGGLGNGEPAVGRLGRTERVAAIDGIDFVWKREAALRWCCSVLPFIFQLKIEEYYDYSFLDWALFIISSRPLNVQEILRVSRCTVRICCISPREGKIVDYNVIVLCREEFMFDGAFWEWTTSEWLKVVPPFQVKLHYQKWVYFHTCKFCIFIFQIFYFLTFSKTTK